MKHYAGLDIWVNEMRFASLDLDAPNREEALIPRRNTATSDVNSLSAPHDGLLMAFDEMPQAFEAFTHSNGGETPGVHVGTAWRMSWANRMRRLEAKRSKMKERT